MLARRLGRTATMQAHHDAGEGAGERAQAAGEEHGMQADERADDQADGETGERADRARARRAARAGVARRVAADRQPGVLSRRPDIEGIDFAPREAVALQALKRRIGIDTPIESAANDPRHGSPPTLTLSFSYPHAARPHSAAASARGTW